MGWFVAIRITRDFMSNHIIHIRSQFEDQSSLQSGWLGPCPGGFQAEGRPRMLDGRKDCSVG